MMKNRPDMTATELKKAEEEWWKRWQEAEARLMKPILDRLLELLKQHNQTK